MDYLGRDKAMAQAQLLLLSEERAALRAARDSATKQVGGSHRAQLGTAVCEAPMHVLVCRYASW
jgi:hypothetical protein